MKTVPNIFGGNLIKQCLVLLSLVSIFIPCIAFAAANHYVRAGATGDGSGSDWTNAWTQLPTTFVRGDTYYVADGDYDGFKIDTPPDGTKVISIVKATSSQHGTDTGWSNSMGDGQATFAYKAFNNSLAAAVLIDTSYIYFDGIVGNGSDINSYGFKLKFPGDCWGNDPSVFMQTFTPSTGTSSGTVTSLESYTVGNNIYPKITDSAQSWTTGNISGGTAKFIGFTSLGITTWYRISATYQNNGTTLYLPYNHPEIFNMIHVGDAYIIKSGRNFGSMPLMWLGTSSVGQHFYGLEVAHIAFPGSVCGRNYRTVSPIGIQATTANYAFRQYGTKIHHNYFDATGTNIVAAHSDNLAIYNNYFGSNYSGYDYEIHGQQISPMGQNIKIYNNIFKNSWIAPIIFHNDRDGSLNYIPNENAEIYNNVFIQDAGYAGNTELSGVISATYAVTDGAINFKMYNNTIIGFPNLGWGVFCVGNLTSSSYKSEAKNNLFVRNASPNFDNCGYLTSNIEHSYSAHFDSTGKFDGSEAGTAQVGIGDPFVDSTHGNFRLKAHTFAGGSLSSPFNIDADGYTRTYWDRGAYEIHPTVPSPVKDFK